MTIIVFHRKPYLIIGGRLAIGVVTAIALLLFLYWVLVYDIDVGMIPPIEPCGSSKKSRYS